MFIYHSPGAELSPRLEASWVFPAAAEAKEVCRGDGIADYRPDDKGKP